VFSFLLSMNEVNILLSMNEVNIKYWCRNFKKQFFYRFSGWIRTFYRRNPICTKKKFHHCALCCLPRKVWLPFSTLPVQLRHFSFWISEWFGPQSILLIFGLREQTPSTIRVFGSFFTFTQNTKYPPISGLKHNKIKSQTWILGPAG
jgi:hypothetical protein